ncbi:MAG: hypothetical protein COA84_13990 [Robiginitomaculum sp.]|nr:MAG: hypothetical protein COA84_13990 [Robiginitomaculum sp.]
MSKSKIEYKIHERVDGTFQANKLEFIMKFMLFWGPGTIMYSSEWYTDRAQAEDWINHDVSITRPRDIINIYEYNGNGDKILYDIF